MSFEVESIIAVHYTPTDAPPFPSHREGAGDYKGGGIFKAAFQGNQACLTDSLGPVTRPSSPS